VVTPVYGCADCLPELAARVRQVMAELGVRHELFLVDDVSPDDALEVGRRLAAADPAVEVLRLRRNLGQQRAVIAGLSRVRGSWTVVLDADLQDPPEAIPALIERGRQGFDAVFAGRRGRYQAPHRMLTSYLFRFARGRLCGVPRDAGLFVALSRRLVDDLLAACDPRPRVVAMIGHCGLPCTSIPVERSPRRHGRSAYSAFGRIASGVAEIAWALRRHLGRGAAGTADPATWIGATYSAGAGDAGSR